MRSGATKNRVSLLVSELSGTGSYGENIIRVPGALLTWIQKNGNDGEKRNRDISAVRALPGAASGLFEAAGASRGVALCPNGPVSRK